MEAPVRRRCRRFRPDHRTRPDPIPGDRRHGPGISLARESGCMGTSRLAARSVRAAEPLQRTLHGVRADALRRHAPASERVDGGADRSSEEWRRPGGGLRKKRQLERIRRLSPISSLATRRRPCSSCSGQWDDGCFALTPLAELLRSDDPRSLRDWAILLADLPYRASVEMLHSLRTGESAFRKVFGVPFFDYLAARPEDTVKLSRGMSSISAART